MDLHSSPAALLRKRNAPRWGARTSNPVRGVRRFWWVRPPLFSATPNRILHLIQRAPKLTSMKLASIICSAALLGPVLLQPSASAQQAAPRQKMDVSKLGPLAGQQVPDFSLKDQDGKTRNLESIMGPKGAMLVFVRSADW